MKKITSNRRGELLLYSLLLLIELAALLILIQYWQLGSIRWAVQWALITSFNMFLVNLFISYIFALLLAALINRLWISNAITVVFLLAYGYSNKEKMFYRHEPILPSDLSMMKDIGRLSGMIEIKHLLIFVSLLVAITLISGYLQFSKKIILFKSRYRLFTRIVTFASTIVVIIGVLTINHVQSPSKILADKIGDDRFFWDPTSGANKNGPILTFINNADSKAMNEPKSYSETRIKKIIAKYKNVAKSLNKQRKNANINKQTLIYVLSESFSDPKRVPSVSVDKDPVQNINAIQKENTSGYMLSSGYGGGTANIEYMASTSLLLNFFSPTISSPFTQIVPNANYSPTVSNLFKRRSAIHTYLSSFYRRSDVYKKFGYQTVRFANSTGSEELKYHANIQKSDYISDDDAYKNVLWQVDQSKRGQFVSLVTMQNHMAYTDKYDHDSYSVSGKGVGNQKKEIENYVEGIHLTDQFTKKFLDKLDNLRKPVTVLWYGDHLAGIWNVNMKKFNIPLHETDYFVYSNRYARQHGYSIGKQKKVQVVSPNVFTPLVLKQMNQKVTPFYAMLTEVMEHLPAISMDSQGNTEGLLVNYNNTATTSKDFNKSQKQLYDDYRLIQYDIVAGQHYVKKFGFMK